jgi:hypothetical protein
VLHHLLVFHHLLLPRHRHSLFLGRVSFNVRLSFLRIGRNKGSSARGKGRLIMATA